MSEKKLPREIKRGKPVKEIMSEYYDEIEKLQPTPTEIQAYADLHEHDYGVVTYSKAKGGPDYFLRFHDTWKKKFGGRIHVDIGYDTTHLMLDKDHAPEFVDFIKKKRRNRLIILSFTQRQT